MPAPKEFKPGPTTSRSVASEPSGIRTKGRHAVVAPPPTPGIATDDEVEIAVDEVEVGVDEVEIAVDEVEVGVDVVELAVDDVTVVMQGPSKYEQRSMNAHVDRTIDIDIDIDALDDTEDSDEPVEVVAPAPAPRVVFGEWRTESELDGTHYHRKDSRRI